MREVLKTAVIKYQESAFFGNLYSSYLLYMRIDYGIIEPLSAVYLLLGRDGGLEYKYLLTSNIASNQKPPLN